MHFWGAVAWGMDTLTTARRPYPTDVSDEEWDFVAPYLTLMTEDAPQRRYPLREVFNACAPSSAAACGGA